MKYQRIWPVYIADMYNLQHQAPDVWAVFMRGDFGCQKSDILGTAIGWDHAGEQVKKIMKNNGGITGKTQNENSRTRHLLVAPILSSISDIIRHHQLSPSYSKRQNENICINKHA